MNKKTLDAIKAGDLYVHCPRCDGRGDIFVYFTLGSEFVPPRGGSVQCPLCYGTREADAGSAKEYMQEQTADQ